MDMDSTLCFLTEVHILHSNPRQNFWSISKQSNIILNNFGIKLQLKQQFWTYGICSYNIFAVTKNLRQKTWWLMYSISIRLPIYLKHFKRIKQFPVNFATEWLFCGVCIHDNINFLIIQIFNIMEITEILIRILYFFLNRSSNIIMDHY